MSLCSYEILLLNSHTSEMTDHSAWETITLRTSIHYQSETLVIYLIWFLSFSTLSATEVTCGWIQPSVLSSEKKATKVAYALPSQLSHGDNGMWHRAMLLFHTVLLLADFPVRDNLYEGFLDCYDLIWSLSSFPHLLSVMSLTNTLSPFLKWSASNDRTILTTYVLFLPF